MALDATVAGASAESYLSVAAADALAAGDLTSDPEVAKWRDTATTTAHKEEALRRATSQVNAALSSGWPLYDPVTQAASGLLFPRAIDYTGTSPKVPFIPRNVRMAVYEQAKFLLRNARTIAAARIRQAHDLQSASEPNLSWSRADDAGGTELSPAAQHYLGAFVQTSAGRGLRSVRLGARLPGAAW